MKNSKDQKENHLLPIESLATATTFLSSTLHEMRTPIQTMIGSLELLKSTSLDKEQLEYVHQIQISSDTLLSLANDILDFSKIKSNGFKLEEIPYDLYAVVEHVADSVSNEVFTKGLELIVDIFPSVPQYIIGDPVRLQQILLNIVKNAAKFTDKGYIHIIVQYDSDKTITFSVEDTGIGIPEQARVNLFTDFYQVDSSTTRKHGGTGLGLSICKALVHAMKGKIGVSPNPAGGSIFYFSIPFVESAKTTTSEKPVIQMQQNTRLLHIDDNFLARKSFQLILQSLGLPECESASEGEAALFMMRMAAREGKPFTHVFVDMSMPKMDGWRLASEINADKHINNAKLYLIVPEGQIHQDAKMKMLNWFNEYLYKPVKISKMQEILSTALTDPIELKSVDQTQPVIDVSKKENPVPQVSFDSNFAKGVKVLIAEDHPVNRKLIMAFLTKMGAEVIQAQDGSEAVKAATEHPEIDIVFMDIQMPVMNGMDATVELRKNNFKGVIVACTANHDKSEFENYLKLGMNDILTKPFKSDAIKTILEKWRNAFTTDLNMQSKQSEQLLPDEDTVWDIADFEDTISNDTELGIQLVDDFLFQTSSLINEIPEAVTEKDFEKLRRIGHTLRGSAATISAAAISTHGSLLNKAAHAKDIDELTNQYKILEEQYSKFKNISSQWKKKNGSEDELSYTYNLL